MRTRFPAALAIFLLALLVRAVYLLQIAREPIFRTLFLDPLFFFQRARLIVSGDLLGGREVFVNGPLYPYFLAPFLAVFPEHFLLVVALVQSLLGALAAVLIAAIAARLHSSTAGVAAGVLAALYGPSVFQDGQLEKTSLAVLLLAAGSLLALASEDGARRGLLLAAGASLGLSCLVRENLILAVAAAALYFLFAPGVRRGAGRAALFLLGAALALLPAAVRNTYVSGQFVLLTTGGGSVFYIGNGPEADGTYRAPPFIRASPEWEHADFLREAERRAGRKLTLKQASDYWRDVTLQHIRQDPPRWLRLMGRKLFLLLHAHEQRDNYPIGVFHELSPLLRVLPGWGIVAPLALLGLALTLRNWRRHLLVYLLLLAPTASILLFFVFGRYRHVLVPLVVPLAGLAIAELLGWVRARRTAPLLAGLAGALAAAVLVHWPQRPSAGEFVLERMAAARNLWNRGDRLAAARQYRRVAGLYDPTYRADAGLPRFADLDPERVDPRHPHVRETLAQVHLALGQIALESGDAAAAGRELEAALRQEPRRSDVAVNLGRALEAAGQTDRAGQSFERAVAIALADGPPELAVSALAERAGFHARRGRARQSVSDLLEALAIAPTAHLIDAVATAARGLTPAELEELRARLGARGEAWADAARARLGR